MTDENAGPSRAVALRLPHEVADALEKEANGIPLATYVRALMARHVKGERAESLFTAHVVTVPGDKDFQKYFSQRHIKLAAVPRKGEYFVINDREGLARAFEVLAVIHPINLGGHAATVEVRARYVGTETDLFVALNPRD